MKALFTNRNFYLIFGSDLILFALAHVGAYLIRFEFHLSGAVLSNMTRILPLIILLKAGIFYGFGLYRGLWRYTGLNDLVRLLKAVVVSNLIVIGVVLMAYRFSGFSRTVFVLDGALTLLFCGGMRLFIRVLYNRGLYGNNPQRASVWKNKRKQKPIIIIGAGDAGEKVLREINDNSDFKLSGRGLC